MATQLIGGYHIRHNQSMLANKRNDDKINGLQGIISGLSVDQKKHFKHVVDILVVGLRDEYSGTEKNHKKFDEFSRKQFKGNLYITQAGLLTVLKTIDEKFDKNANETLLALCTHRNPRLSGVCSYPKTLKDLLSECDIYSGVTELNSIKQQLDLAARFGFTCIDKDFIMLAEKYLPSMDLVDTDLRDFDLSEATLNYARLRKAKLRGANLTKALLKFATLIKADLSNADLNKANLYGTHLNDAKLIDADLSGADLIGADLSGANLSGADLIGADLSGANLSGANLIGANFTGAIFDGVDTIRLEINKWRYEEKHLYLHSDDKLCKILLSIFNTIQSIDDKYKDLKINLMQQVTAWFDEKKFDISTEVKQLSDILLNNDIYFDDNQIKKFIVNKNLFDLLISKSETENSLFTNMQIKKLSDHINTLDNKDEFMIKHSSFINQFIYQSKSSNDEATKEIGCKMQEDYFNLKEIKAIKDTLPIMIHDNDSVYIFIKDYQESKKTFCFQKEYLDKYIYGKSSESKLLNFWCFKDGVQQHNENLKNMVDAFPIFTPSYLDNQSKCQRFINLLDKLTLLDYYPQFKDNLEKDPTSKQYISSEKQGQLNKIFVKYFVLDEEVTNSTITQEHVNQILQIYQLEDKINTVQAQYLLFLAGIFAKFGSKMFIVTNDSYTKELRGLKIYALALMNKAIELHPNIVPKQQADAWIRQLTNEYTIISSRHQSAERDHLGKCTEDLSGNIFSYCKQQFPEVAKAIIPPAWVW